jgi:hypothetical protein
MEDAFQLARLTTAKRAKEARLAALYNSLTGASHGTFGPLIPEVHSTWLCPHALWAPRRPVKQLPSLELPSRGVSGGFHREMQFFASLEPDKGLAGRVAFAVRHIKYFSAQVYHSNATIHSTYNA